MTNNNQMLFQYKGVSVSPYTQNGVVQDSVFFEYDFCGQIAIPKFPSNYQPHCNLMVAGIGTQIAALGAFTMTLLSFVHSVVILMGYSPWNVYHKMDWICSLIASFCFLAAAVIWQFLGHSDIVSNRELYSEAHAGMKVETEHGIGMILYLVCAVILFAGTFKMRLYIWSMKVEALRHKYADSVATSNLMSDDLWDFIKGEVSGSETESLH